MRLGKDFPESWKIKSEKDSIPLSDLLYGYAVEDLLTHIENTSFFDYLWLTNEEALGEDAYKKKVKTSLEYIYVESKKRIFSDRLAAGQAFSPELIDVFLKEVFDDFVTDVQWQYIKKDSEHEVQLLLTCTYMEIKVPVSVYIREASLSTQSPKQKETKRMLHDKKTYRYLSYSKEGVLAESLFEIMRKLELISDMEAYDVANEILKTQPVSGRHVVEDFAIMGEKETKVVTMKRLDQLESYKNYTYMKKKWKQYARNHKENADEWEEVLERLMNFMRPIWKALCENEVFFDDWMPELGRFLG